MTVSLAKPRHFGLFQAIIVCNSLLRNGLQLAKIMPNNHPFISHCRKGQAVLSE
jgi:hypothetical protein